MSAADRRTLAGLLAARGFNLADADGFVARLDDARVSRELAWHDREQAWHNAGPASTWTTAQRAEVNQHYLVDHGVDPMWLITHYWRDGVQGTAEGSASASPGKAGVVMLGAAFVGLVGLWAWHAGQRKGR